MLHSEIKLQKNMQGIALLVVLLFMQIIAIFGLYALQMAILETKQAQLTWRRNEIRSFAEQALYTAENNLQINVPHCVIPVTPVAQILSYPLSWWRSPQSCAGNFQTFQYYYRVELVGNDPCGYIQLYPQKNFATYFRITLLGVSGDTKILLQSTIIKPNRGDDSSSCSSVSHVVSIGRQMWRELKAS
ncbi:MAG: hypothetical protein ACYCQI_04245 [Gammaproteobacteria bacterium]